MPAFRARLHVSVELLRDRRAAELIANFAAPYNAVNGTATLTRLFVPTQPRRSLDGSVEMIVIGCAEIANGVTLPERNR